MTCIAHCVLSTFGSSTFVNLLSQYFHFLSLSLSRLRLATTVFQRDSHQIFLNHSFIWTCWHRTHFIKRILPSSLFFQINRNNCIFEQYSHFMAWFSVLSLSLSSSLPFSPFLFFLKFIYLQFFYNLFCNKEQTTRNWLQCDRILCLCVFLKPSLSFSLSLSRDMDAVSSLASSVNSSAQYNIAE